ncbi:hypothetical protein BG006_010982 [Podila minutissima]|uniref:Uncharacterized protein n=1 Tax=Podila minutissima TaxID=64525 RepID=A0A9P5SFB8_9FUNG|nr:hypothetical protein BG006_010982 [Podila minutissima]
MIKEQRRMSVGSTVQSPHPPSSTSGISMYILQLRDKYTETLLILEENSKRLKRILERSDLNNAESGRRFYEEVSEALRGLLELPSYVFVPCIPDQPLPGAADTFHREDLVQIQQKGQETGSSTPDVVASAPKKPTSPSQPAKTQPTKPMSSTNGPPTLSLALPESLSSFLFPDQHLVPTNTNNTASFVSSPDLTQRLRDTILPEYDHLSIKQEESLQSMTTLLNHVSSVQEFEELEDEIIDMLQLSATDPSAHQRDISALSEIRSKLAEITGQLESVQNSQAQGQQQQHQQNGSYRRLNGGLSGTAPTIPTSSSMVTGGGGLAAGKRPKIAGMARMFEERGAESLQHSAMNSGRVTEGYEGEEAESSQFIYSSSLQVVSKLDQLLLLLEFVNTAQCHMMAYQDLQYDKSQEPNVDDGWMMAVQEHMEQMDKKMTQQMHLLRRIVTLQGTESQTSNAAANSSSSTGMGENEGGVKISETHDGEIEERENLPYTQDRVDNELTLVEVLNRLDLQVIPSVQDQSNRIYELSDQLSEMKRQLDEQQRRLQETLASPPPSRPRVATTAVIARSNSIERTPTSALFHSRSASQVSVHQQQLQQQQQQQQFFIPSEATSPLDVESPALWRASLKPSNSTGSSASLPSGSTSDRIADMLDRMDATMTFVIDEQLARYEKGNKELLAKVFEHLEADDDDDDEEGEEEESSALSDGSTTVKQSGSASMASKKAATVSQQRQQQQQQQLLSDEESPTAIQWPTEPFERLKDLLVQESDRSENALNDQRDEILERMHHLQSSIQDSHAMESSREGAIKDELQEMRDWIVTHSSRQTEHLRELLLELAVPPKHSDTGLLMDKMHDDDGVATELSATLSLNKATPPPPPPPVASTVDEDLIREVIKDQLEMFTRVQMATFSEMSDNLTGVERMMRDMAKMMGLQRGGTVLRKKEAEEGRAMLAMDVKETIEEVMTRCMSALPPVVTALLPRTGSLDSGVNRALNVGCAQQGLNEESVHGSSGQVNGMRRGENGSSGSGSGIFKGRSCLFYFDNLAHYSDGDRERGFQGESYTGIE